MSGQDLGYRGYIRLITDSIGAVYRIERELGSGGMSIVYQAHDLRNDRTVAVKVLRPELSAMTAADRFLREIEITRSLDHPNILPLLDSGEFNGTSYYVMPAVSGETLRDYLDTSGRLPIMEAIAIAKDVAGALAHAHEKGIVHRDIKPENILLSEEQAVVVDFGIARAVTRVAGDRITSKGMMIGTPEYMSPEQANDSTTIDGRSDLYSLGCVLYEMLAGSPPFTGRSVQAIIARQLTELPLSLELLRSSIPSGILVAVNRLLRKLPGERLATAEELSHALLDQATK